MRYVLHDSLQAVNKYEAMICMGFAHHAIKQSICFEDEMTTIRLPTKLRKEPLVDAIFEIRFSSYVPASSVLPGVLFSSMAGENIQVEKLPTADLPSQLRDSDPNLRFHPLLRLHCGQFLILIGDNSLGVACKMPYAGWAAFKEKIITTFNNIKDTKIIGSIDRYAIKYVDVVAGNTLSEQISRLNMQLQLGHHTLASESFNVRVEIQRDGFTHVVHVAAPASVIDTDGNNRQGVITEIDSICEYQTNDLNNLSNSLSERLEQLHLSNKKMFFECLTNETIDYLEPVYE